MKHFNIIDRVTGTVITQKGDSEAHVRATGSYPIAKYKVVEQQPIVSREQLEADALAAVCACYAHQLTNEIEFIEDIYLKAVLIDPQFLHYVSQSKDPVSTDECKVELRACPSYKGA